MRDPHWWLTKFEADGLLRRDVARFRTTRRWQAAMARAALRLYGSRIEDLRAPVAGALMEIYGDGLDDESIIEAVRVMLPIEGGELAPS